ncbi:hypothetical protein B0I35DRAFT_480912 [Stachybotrys elegans]|uniref:gamma-glutamylcyclotransferase n=1 Tax=Stachybotrys elegans TaxID=80388 RepID=A0A8K0SK04_9HYPO|nr:hypothetical protein B0I35DRAFT_480912 [Stachybotrys elegans]
MSEPKACSVAAIRRNVADRWQKPRPHAPIAAIPQTSPERLAQAQDGDAPHSSTRLYLAYGSNLSAETFLGHRGIRPLSQVNVTVPTLRLTFDLPGLPYWEPCFANVAFRKLPEKPKLPIPGQPPKIPPFEPPHHDQNVSDWNGGLVGVVYEVTSEDYDTIIRTEGGGSSYKEVVVPCIPIPPRFATPEKPPFPELPKPFFARTLFAPYLPNTDEPDDPRKDKWWYRFVTRPVRPAPDYAQASPRYLKLITDGAREHDIPEEYQLYLQSLTPYKPTTCWQQVGKYLFLLAMLIPFLLIAPLVFLVGKKANYPPWMATLLAVAFNLTWMLYDNVFKPIFGDGERTQEEEESRTRPNRYGRYCDEEKASLL